MASDEPMITSAGPGKYDDLCTNARLAAGARGAILIVLGGLDGSGFSVQMPQHLVATLPRLLRELADGVEHQQEQEQEQGR